MALAEFAMVLPLLLVLLLGIIDFGKALNYWLDETHLANEGARFAAVNNWPGKTGGTTLQQYLLARVGGEGTTELHGDTQGTQQSRHSAQVCIDWGTGVIGDPVTVTVKYNYDWLHYLTAQEGIGPTTTISGTSTMRMESTPGLTGVACT